MKNNRILIIVGGSYVSGLENITLHLIRGVKAQGFDVRCIVSGWNDGVFKGSLQEAGIPFTEAKLGWLYVTHPLWTLDSLRHWRGAYRHYRQVLTEFNPDLIHFTNFASPLMIYPLLKGRKCLYALHETHLPNRKHLFIYRRLNKRMQVFTAVSGHIVNVLTRLGIPKEKTKLIYNGVPAAAVSSVTDAPELRIGIVGQVADWKGHDTLVDAVAELAAGAEAVTGAEGGVRAGAEKGTRAVGVAFSVGIYGNDQNPYAEGLKQRIAEKGLSSYFTWHGFVRDQEQIYSSLDVVVVPSLSEEPCSLTILETMMRGKAIVVSARGGNTELVKDGIDGKVFAAGDGKALAACLRLFLEDRGLSGTFAIKAREKALHAFTVRRMVDEYIRVYEGM